MRVGFIGLGSQGTPIAERIAHSGIAETVVWARRPEALDRFRGGPARIAESPAELGKGLDLLVTCVFDAASTHQVLFGPGGAAHAMPSGSLIVCHSTVAAQQIIDLAAEAGSLGLRLLDAPVTGGALKAAAGELVVMVGGAEADYRIAVPVIETYASLVLRLGPVGAGQQAKLLNNTMFAAHLGIAHDAFALAAELGLDPAGLGQILRNGSARSYGLEVYLGSGSLEPMTRSALRPALTKDVALLTEATAGQAAGEVLLSTAQQFITALTRAAQNPT